MEEVYVQRVEALINYLELHLTSLYQDAEKLSKLLDEYQGDLDSDEYRGFEIDDITNTGEIAATQHILSVVNDMMVTWKREK